MFLNVFGVVVNTKAEVRFHVLSAEWIPHRVRQRVIALHKTRMTKFGEMIVMSQKYRTQQKNLEDAIQKLRQLLLEASEVPKGPSELTVARVQALKRKADRKRRVDKKYHSIKKTFRKQIDID
jgi:protein subunit release factor B